jgi:hypothetical protein
MPLISRTVSANRAGVYLAMLIGTTAVLKACVIYPHSVAVHPPIPVCDAPN